MNADNRLNEMAQKIELLRSSALRIFNENIQKDIIGDLNILDNIQPETHGNGCSVPTAMVILSSLDFIGFILSEKGKLKESGKYIEKALKHKNYFPRETYSDEVIKTLIRFFRHGMMHSFYPIRTTSRVFGIHKSNQDELLEDKSCNGQEITSLNVNTLSRDFKFFINKLHDEINTTSDDAILKTISKRLKLVDPMINNYPTTTKRTTFPIGVKM